MISSVKTRKLLAMKIYNVSQASKKIGVSRQILHAWIGKSWVKPKRDYRDYPVFSEADVKNVIAWRKEVRAA